MSRAAIPLLFRRLFNGITGYNLFSGGSLSMRTPHLMATGGKTVL